VLSIQAGENPRILADRLATFLAPTDRHDRAKPAPAAAEPEPEPVAEAA